jgi:hypothetical protein
MTGMALTRTKTPISIEVIEAVAEATDQQPTRMDPPLHEVVDTDALESLLASDEAVSVTFAYDGHAVTVDGRGSVTVDGERRA